MKTFVSKTIHTTLKCLAFIFLMYFQPSLLASDVQKTKNPNSGLLSWKIDSRGFSLELIQLLPDFVRAIYGSHEFPREAIEDIASYCVFGTIAINTSDKSLFYRVSDWYALTPDGEKHTIKTKNQWLDEWRKMGIRYSWTILPAEQTFETGDWSQGFTTIKLPRDESFDLVYNWKLNGENYVGKISNMSCAPISLEGK